jgi:glucan phosphorylase
METEQIEKKGNPYVEAQISGEQHSQLEQWLKDEEPIEIATGSDSKVYLINIKGSQELQKKVARVLAEHHRQGSRGQNSSASFPEEHDWNCLLFLHSEDSQCLVRALRLDKAKATAEIAAMVE